MDIIKPKDPDRSPSPPLIEAPSGYGYCDSCFFWRGKEREACVMPTGVMMDKTEMVKQGIPMPVGSFTARVKTCVRYPDWQLRAEQHWCGDYAQMLVRNPLKR